MGEEGTRIETGSDYKWYVDPLDGTTNFAHGYPVFCVSLAVERKGQRIAGVIYDPTRDEMFSAELGGGARLNAGAIGVSAPHVSPLHVSTTPTLAECLIATGFPSQKRHKNPNIYFYHQLTLRTPRCQARRIGGARSVQRRVGPFRRLLGIQSQSLGYGGGCAHRAGGRREGY